MRALVVAAVLGAVATAHADTDTDDVSTRTIVFTRGTKLFKADARGRGETELATLPARRTVRALRVDPTGSILLADIGGTWAWMPLDGRASTLTDLPCDPGPALLGNDGRYVLCRGKAGSIVVNFKTGKVTPIDVPTAGARLTGSGSELRIVWADAQGIWSAVPPLRRQPKKLAPQAPLRHLTVSPDGRHALGIYSDEVFENAKKKTIADVLMVFALDGVGARRLALQNGVPVEWSHDSKWVLVQDGSSACIMLAAGGQYKCWRGYTAQSISPDGKYALLLGNRDRGSSDDDKKSKKSKKSKSKKSDKKSKKDKKKQAPPPDEQVGGEAELPGDMHGDDPVAADEIPVAPPTGPLALYRGELDGAFTKTPPLVVREVDGAAVFVPTR